VLPYEVQPVNPLSKLTSTSMAASTGMDITASEKIMKLVSSRNARNKP
jgi:hypothetical protein